MLKVIKPVHWMLFLLYFISSQSVATTWVISEGDDLVGEVQYSSPEIGETLDEVGKRFNMGHNEMVRANPQVDAVRPLSPNTKVIIPSQYLLPKGLRKGIVINLSEYRLYYFPMDENVVLTFPVGIGRAGWNTPLGETKVIAKEINPIWRPTSKIQSEAKKNGVLLPEVFPAGIDNPLGKYALRLNWPAILIHGTNGASRIGDRVSAGCIRMLPEDIEQLYSIVPVGTIVNVINQPVKIGTHDQSLLMQLYPLIDEHEPMNLESILQQELLVFHYPDWSKNKIINNELSYPSGLVRKIR